jgi:hypothetical protein
MDLAVAYKGGWNIIEVKLLRQGSFDALMKDGRRQTLRYRDSLIPSLQANKNTLPDCYLVIFDRRPQSAKLSWSKRLKWIAGDEVTVVGC